MRGILGENRFIVFGLSLLVAIGCYGYVYSIYSSEQLQIIRLTQSFGLLAIAALYLAMVINPLSYFLHSQVIVIWKSLRWSFVIVAFFFGLLHSLYAFFGQLGGFPGLPFLSDYYLLGVTLSFTALLILSALTFYAIKLFVNKVNLNRENYFFSALYIVGILILIHALLLGTHFHDLSEFIPVFLFVAISFFILLEVMVYESKILKPSLFMPRFGIISMVVFLILCLTYFWYLNPSAGSENSSPISVHSQHISTIETDSPLSQNNPFSGLYMPGMEGDKSKRFNINFNYSEPLQINVNTNLSFKITDGSNGDPIYFFQTPYEKPFHLIIVNSDLSYFSHIHPTQQSNVFSIETQFPKNDLYHVYGDFQPFGAVEQQQGFQVQVGEPAIGQGQTPVFEYEKTVDNYVVRLSFDQTLKSNLLSIGEQELKFSIQNSDGSPVTTLFPYLNSFGHLVMIKKDTFEYVHAHPVMTKPVQANERSGPEVRFVPMSLYSKVSPGVYKVFAQFNPNGKLITVDFWVEVK